MMRLMNTELASARSLFAETIMIFRSGLFHSFQTTKAHVMNDFPMPRNACKMNRRESPAASFLDMEICCLVGTGRLRAAQRTNRKATKFPFRSLMCFESGFIGLLIGHLPQGLLKGLYVPVSILCYSDKSFSSLWV
ncbi:hypothetical protein DNJENNLF_00003 [Pseudomonas phage phi C106]|nr:hypothetical protein DNJENNLF_00003 [Pseudomonas phage phi C106]